MSDRVLMELADGVLTGTLNRPDKKNAIDAAMLDGLDALIDRADLDAAVRVVALRGAEPDFCAGMDLNELLASADHTLDQNRAAALRFGGVFERMRALPKPIVAVVRGRALAGGCGLATACDVVVAAASARFGYPEVLRGFVPALVTNLLRRAVGEKVAFDLVATGRVLSAAEAQAVGLISRVVPDAELDSHVSQLLRTLAGIAPSSLALTKRVFYGVDGLDLAAGIRLAADVNALSRSTPDFRAAIQAFLKT